MNGICLKQNNKCKKKSEQTSNIAHNFQWVVVLSSRIWTLVSNAVKSFTYVT